MFITDFTSVDYWIKPSSGFQVITPSILQFYPGCPIECSLKEAGANSVIHTAIFSVAAPSGQVSVKSTSTADAANYSLQLSCTSTLSSHAAKTTVDNFMVALKVPGPRCYSDILGFSSPIPQSNDYIIEMWSGATAKLFNPGLTQSVYGCPVYCTLG